MLQDVIEPCFDLSACCQATYVVDCGFNCCTECGSIVKRELDTNHISFTQSLRKVSKSYTRSARFTNKIVGSLLQRTTFRPKVEMIKWMDARRMAGLLENPEDLIISLSAYPASTRRPYVHASSIWSEMTTTPTLVTPSEHEIRFLTQLFDEIFFVWTRLDIPRPRLPMSQAILLIVTHFDFSDEMRFLARFVRRLKCTKRQERYLRLFKKCIAYIQNDEHRRKRFAGYKMWPDSRED